MTSTQAQHHNADTTLGQRLAHLRKSRGLTQTELAEQLGTSQTIVSDYEHDQRRLHADMIVRVAQILGASTDEVLGTKILKKSNNTLSLKLTRRMQKIEALPPAKQKNLLQTVDALLKAAGK